ncbi:MAG: hypothetical protein QM601_08685 [Pseudoxanthomonas sp.]
MYWICLLLAAGFFIGALRTTSVTLMLVCLLVALALAVIWVLGMLSARMAGRNPGPRPLIDPAELRRLRAQAEARKASAQAEPTDPQP